MPIIEEMLPGEKPYATHVEDLRKIILDAIKAEPEEVKARIRKRVQQGYDNLKKGG